MQTTYGGWFNLIAEAAEKVPNETNSNLYAIRATIFQIPTPLTSSVAIS